MKEKKWQPSGVPTIYKIIEYLDSNYTDTMFVFTIKPSESNYAIYDKEVPFFGNISGLSTKVKIIRGQFSYNNNKIIIELFHLINLFYIIIRNKPKIIYIDNANILSASILCRFFTKTPMVLRIMGVYPFMKNIFHKNSIKNNILKWSYNAPYKAVICSQDGSGVDDWLNKAINLETKTHTLINGVDSYNYENINNSNEFNFPEDKTKILFIGKLEYHKGIEEFFESFLLAYEKSDKKLHAVIVGVGGYKPKIEKKILELGLTENVTFFENLEHNKISKLHMHADIYISLNRYGNFSNANLEAINAGQCMIIPKSQPETKVDLIVDKFLSNKSVMRISSVDNIDEISDAILKLHNNPELRKSMSSHLKKEAKEFLYSWDERIKKEINILEEISQ